jgi:nicotinamide-nucleotide amidase
MNAQIISIGTELAIGQTVDTNSAWLAQRLAEIGIHCTRHTTIADELAPIVAAIKQASIEADLLLISGGLGPTIDDLTRQALADAMGKPLVFHQASMEQIEAYFRARNRSMHPDNRVQAMIPQGAAPIENTNGTAPGMSALLNKAHIFVMPGVPREMQMMFVGDVLPKLPRGDGGVILQHSIRTFGMPEAEAGQKIAGLMARGRNPTVGTSAADLIITIRINAHASTREEAQRLIDADAVQIRQLLGRAVFGEGDMTISDAVGRLLIDQQLTISTAESCTGGLIAKRLTDVSGSSAYFTQAFVTYANESKMRLLEIPDALFRSHGAVSAEVAHAMAANGRRISGTDYSLSATGIAGPTGGTADKPVGLVYIGIAGPRGVEVKEFRFGELLGRDEIRDRAAKAALNLLRLSIKPS